MENRLKRDPEILLPLSLRFAKEYLNKLCEMQADIKTVQESKELTMIHRALWTGIIIEIGRLFDTHTSKEVISFKKLPHLKSAIDKYHGEAVIGKIITTRNTLIGHFAKDSHYVIPALEICQSNLGQILDGMSQLSIKNNRSGEPQNQY